MTAYAEGISTGPLPLHGDLLIPENCKALIVFAHGSGSSKYSTRNRKVAAALNARGLATVLIDLLTGNEDSRIENRFDIDLLASRLHGVLQGLARHPRTVGLPIGLFGASTGAAAAIKTAAQGTVFAIVSRGGRVDLAGGAARSIECPILLIVGGEDTPVLEWNREVLPFLPAASKLEVIPGATHLFEEPGALDEVARLAGDWFLHHAPATQKE